ncbi:MAG: peptide deformylase [Alistipes sp.]|nr:peptide deformylase [Alistipes sp.]
MVKYLYLILMLMSAMSCSEGFTTAEREVINAGQGDVMYVLSIAHQSDSVVLRSQSKPLTCQMVSSEEFATLRRRMLATVQSPEHQGVGIAAPQVGILRRVVAVQRFDKADEPFEFFINPEIVEFSDEVAAGGEGCLSVPDIHDDVIRSQRITLRYYDENFEQHEQIIEGFTAVIFQHEIDHLDGKLFIDYLEEK